VAMTSVGIGDDYLMAGRPVWNRASQNGIVTMSGSAAGNPANGGSGVWSSLVVVQSACQDFNHVDWTHGGLVVWRPVTSLGLERQRG